MSVTSVNISLRPNLLGIMTEIASLIYDAFRMFSHFLAYHEFLLAIIARMFLTKRVISRP